MIEIDPEERLTLEEIREHDWMREQHASKNEVVEYLSGLKPQKELDWFEIDANPKDTRP